MYQCDAAVPLAASLLLYGKGRRDVSLIQTLAAVTSNARLQSWRRTFSADEEEQQRTRNEAIFEVDGLSPTRRPRSWSHSSITGTSSDAAAAKQARVPKQTTARGGDPYECDGGFGFENPLGCDVRMVLDSDEGLMQRQPWLFEFGEIFVDDGPRSQARTLAAAQTRAGEARHG